MAIENEPVMKCWACDNPLPCPCGDEAIPVEVIDTSSIFNKAPEEWNQNGWIPLCGTGGDVDPEAYPDS
jgi:hypothetical protein